MKTLKIITLAICTIFISCNAPIEESTDNTDSKDETTAENTVGASTNQETEIRGIAKNRKGGAVVIANEVHYWIEGKHSWEANFLDQTVLVKGEVEIRDDNPVFLDTGGVVMQGIPVNSEAELEAHKNRTWIVNAKVSLVKK